MPMNPRLLRPTGPRGRYRSLRVGLVAYWPFEEDASSGDVTAEDWTGRGNNLTSNNSVLSVAGLKGNARNFVAANSEFLSSATKTDLQWGDADFTWAWWFYIPTGTTFTGGAHVITSDANSPRDSQFFMTNQSSRPGAYLRYTDNTEQGPLYFGTTGTVTADTWHFCAFRKSGAALSLRFNTSVTSATASVGKTLGCPGTPAGFRLAARLNSPNYFAGYLDEVAKWSRALSDAELDTLYNGGTGIDLRT
jgi:hypothetical protein